MNHTKTAKLSNIFLAVTAILFIPATWAAAQEKLGDMVIEGGFEWIIGEWTTKTEQGQEIQSFYKFGLDGHVVNLGFNMGEFEGRGMIYLDPLNFEIIQLGADNRGGIVKGIWEDEGDKAVARLQYIGPDGQRSRTKIVHSNIDADTMKVEIYRPDSEGEFPKKPSAVMEYKRRKKQTEKKEDKEDKKQEKKSDNASDEKIKYEFIPIGKIGVVK